jgi:hypothetical protein
MTKFGVNESIIMHHLSFINYLYVYLFDLFDLFDLSHVNKILI